MGHDKHGEMTMEMKENWATYVLTDAGLAEELEELELPKRPETEHRVIKRRDLLDCDLAATRPVHR